MKHHARQNEFGWADEPFALVAETATDHERRQREEAQRERDRADAATRQTLISTAD